jgi:hypothetical protein
MWSSPKNFSFCRALQGKFLREPIVQERSRRTTMHTQCRAFFHGIFPSVAWKLARFEDNRAIAVRTLCRRQLRREEEVILAGSRAHSRTQSNRVIFLKRAEMSTSRGQLIVVSDINKAIVRERVQILFLYHDFCLKSPDKAVALSPARGTANVRSPFRNSSHGAQY